MQKSTLLSNRFAFKGVRSVMGVLRTINEGYRQAILVLFPFNHATRASVVVNALESNAIREPRRFFVSFFLKK
jgi:hypothetical protein